MKEKNMKDISRRNFLTGSAAFAGVLGAGVFAGCSSEAPGANASAIEWSEETDVVVIGFGGAGATAAIGASDAGASVILLEKAPEEDAGGNTSVSGGSGLFPTEDVRDTAFEFLRYQMPELIITDEEINGFIDELLTQADWLKAHGATVDITDGRGAMYGGLPIASGLNKSMRIGGNGAGLFAFLKSATEGSAGVQIHYQTPAKKLIFDPQTKEVFGVVAQTSEGLDINIKAKRGVVMACGGFENDPYFKNTYYAPEVPIYPCGTPYNTGDGLKMISEIGAKVRGFSSIEWGCHCCKPASEEIGVYVGNTFMGGEPWSNAIMVNDQGRRFVNETQPVVPTMPAVLRPLHEKSQLPELAFDMNTLRYTNLPMFMIFGEEKIGKGAIFTGASKDAGNHWAHIHDWYTWSDDNQAEISRGWIVRADSLDELADKLGLNAAGLNATVAAYDLACATGTDQDFARTDMLSPIGSGPYYGCELGLGIINTQGGPARDAEHHVLDLDDKPISRLYSAGEFGSIYVFLYQGAGNISETIGGRVAGENASLEAPWE